MKNDFIDIQDQMKSSKVISFGEALIDRLGPLGGDPSCDKPVKDCFGGAPANVACALSRLGVSVSLVSALGNDPIGKDFKNLMIDRGINIFGLQEDKLRPTRIVLVRREDNGERVFGGFEGEKGLGFADQAISKKKIIQDWQLVSKKAKWLIIGTIPLASEISADAFLWCVEKAFNSGIKIAIDLNWRPTFWRKKASKSLAPTLEEKIQINSILKNASLIKLAKEEAEWFFDSSNSRDISCSLSQRPSVIVTDGPHTVGWFLNNIYGKSNVISPSSIIDTTGAGDAFTAGIIYKLLSIDLDEINQKIAQDIIQFAIACGAYVCKGAGAINPQPYLEDIDNFLSLYKGGMS